MNQEVALAVSHISDVLSAVDHPRYDVYKKSWRRIDTWLADQERQCGALFHSFGSMGDEDAALFAYHKSILRLKTVVDLLGEPRSAHEREVKANAVKVFSDIDIFLRGRNSGLPYIVPTPEEERLEGLKMLLDRVEPLRETIATWAKTVKHVPNEVTWDMLSRLATLKRVRIGLEKSHISSKDGPSDENRREQELRSMAKSLSTSVIPKLDRMQRELAVATAHETAEEADLRAMAIMAADQLRPLLLAVHSVVSNPDIDLAPLLANPASYFAKQRNI